MEIISTFFKEQMVSVFFIYGLAFFAMGLAIAMESRRASGLHLAQGLGVLAVFGLTHGLVGWMDMLLSIPRGSAGPPTALLFHEIQPVNCMECHGGLVAVKPSTILDPGSFLEGTKLALLVVSAVCLVQFGSKLRIVTRKDHYWLKWAPVGLLGLWTASLFVATFVSPENDPRAMITIGGILARYILFVPGSVLAAVALMSQHSVFRDLQLPRIARDSVWAGVLLGLNGVISGLIVPPAPFFPASVVNYATFFALTGMPVQVVKAVIALAATFFVVRILRIFQIEYDRRLELANQERFQAQQATLEAQRRAQEQLEEWNRELEERIRQRTSEIEQRNREVTILEERDRIAREMHDSLGQVLGYLSLKTLSIEKLLAGGEDARALKELQGMEQAIQGACADVRESILSLRTSPSPQGGLIPVLTEYLDKFSDQTELKTALEVQDGMEAKFAPAVEIQLLRIIQEGLTNVRKHAGARQAVVRFGSDGDRAQITVEDDGRGFEPGEVARRKEGHFGLQTMQERAEGVGGTFEIDSRPGGGTRITVTVPYLGNGGCAANGKHDSNAGG